MAAITKKSVHAGIRTIAERRDRRCETTDPSYHALMNHRCPPAGPIRTRALAALAQAFAHQRPDVPINPKGYAADFRDTLLPVVDVEDFEADLSAGDGNELRTKFCAAHSSFGLAVNCFAPFRRRMSDLSLPGLAGVDTLQFERNGRPAFATAARRTWMWWCRPRRRRRDRV
jgi:hypothetical protein